MVFPRREDSARRVVTLPVCGDNRAAQRRQVRRFNLGSLLSEWSLEGVQFEHRLFHSHFTCCEVVSLKGQGDNMSSLMEKVYSRECCSILNCLGFIVLLCHPSSPATRPES